MTCTYGYDGPFVVSEAWSGAVSRTLTPSFLDSTETVSVGGTASTVVFEHDADDLLTKIRPPGGAWTFDLTRNAASGVLEGTSVGSGAGQVTSSHVSNAYGELSELHYQRGGAALFSQWLTRNAIGQVTRIEESWSGGPRVRRDYGYDAAGRLDSLAVDGVPERRWEYDAGAPGNGNRTAEYGAGDLLWARGAYDAQDRLLTYGLGVDESRAPGADSVHYVSEMRYTYTAAGELSGTELDGALWRRTTYDALGNLTGAKVGLDSLRYVIDGQNRRVGVVRNGVRERGWLYGGAVPPLAELAGDGTLRHRYVYGTLSHAPDLLLRGDTAYRVVTDHLGSVRAVVRTTDGAIVQRTDYDAWGGITADTAGAFQSLGYAGGLTDRTTGLVRFGARDYDASVGRWTGKDRLGVLADHGNCYSYVSGDPVSAVDPWGMAGQSPQAPSRPTDGTEGAQPNCAELIAKHRPDPIRLARGYGRLARLRVLGHQLYPGEANSRRRHQWAAEQAAEEVGIGNARAAGLGNEVQGFLLHDLPRLRERWAGHSPWAFQFGDLLDNEIGFNEVARRDAERCGCREGQR